MNKVEPRCPVCDHRTIEVQGTFEICPVCFWEDDGIYTDPDVVMGGPNGDLSLTQARNNFKEFGAISREFTKNVRPPLETEL